MAKPGDVVFFYAGDRLDSRAGRRLPVWRPALYVADRASPGTGAVLAFLNVQVCEDDTGVGEKSPVSGAEGQRGVAPRLASRGQNPGQWLESPPVPE